MLFGAEAALSVWSCVSVVSFVLGKQKTALPWDERFGKCDVSSGLGLLDESSLDGLDAYPHALDLARWEADLDALYVWTELTLGGLGYVRTDASAFLGLSLAVDD